MGWSERRRVLGKDASTSAGTGPHRRRDSLVLLTSAWDPAHRPALLRDARVTTRQEAMRALYEGSLAEPGDRNPYAGQSLVLAKLWMRGYRRMLRVRINTGPAMARYLEARAKETR